MSMLDTTAGDTDDTAPISRLTGIHVRETGFPGAPAVVFLHGSAASGGMWTDHMARLAGYHCLAPRPPRLRPQQPAAVPLSPRDGGPGRRVDRDPGSGTQGKHRGPLLGRLDLPRALGAPRGPNRPRGYRRVWFPPLALDGSLPRRVVRHLAVHWHPTRGVGTALIAPVSRGPRDRPPSGSIVVATG